MVLDKGNEMVKDIRKKKKKAVLAAVVTMGKEEWMERILL